MDIITRILVTGTEGYLGSLLAPELMRQGYEVIGLDTGFYKERAFYRDGGTTPLTLAKDLRHVGVEDLKNVRTKSTTRVRFILPNLPARRE